MIEVKDVWKSYGSVDVLKGLSLKVETGKTLVILGRSGAGKSVLLKQIIGIEKPDRGEVIVHSQVISQMNERALYQAVKDMGILFQGAALFDSLNVFENTAFALRQHKDRESGRRIAESEIQDRVQTALAMVGLENTENKMPSDLSGGMRKRAALARLLVYRPRTLLYDEPTAGLDPMTSLQINELICKVQEELGATSIVVTHNLQSAYLVGNQFAMHHEGKIAHTADKDAFFCIEDPLVHDYLAAAGYTRTRFRGQDKK